MTKMQTISQIKAVLFSPLKIFTSSKEMSTMTINLNEPQDPKWKPAPQEDSQE